jgi:CelD/BcsL family acetyltransferase involved in cellulose biosynthesis
MILQIKKLTEPSALETLLPEWEALDARVTPRTPFTSPMWIRLWWQHCRRRTILTRDEFFLHTLRDRSGQLIAIAPLMVTHKPAFGAPRVRLLQFIGADPSLTEVRGLVCRLEQQDAVIRALNEYLYAHKSEWDLLLWNGIRNSGLAADTLSQLNGLRVSDALPCYVLDLPESWERLLLGLSGNMRKNVRKSYEFLNRDAHKIVFRSRNRPEDICAALERFISLHAARAAAKDMKRHPDRFSVASHRAILFDFAQQMAECDRLHMLQLEIDGAVVATRVAFRLGDDLYLYYSGFDPAWRKYSVMTTLMAETLRWAMEHGIKRVNLSTGTDLGKLRWRPDEILYYNAIQVSPTLRGWLAFRAYQAITSRD